jgi:membrane protease YdiL (CAAX protease family)
MSDAAIVAQWNRLPVLVRAIVSGVAVGAAGTTPWALLVSANMKNLPTVPWAVLIMSAYLWLFWRYVTGAGWPRSTARARRTNSRANALTSDVWGRALLAGILGLASLLSFMGVLGRLVALPKQQDIDISQYPLVTVFFWIIMSAAVAGVVEETAFRGYLQRPMERRHGAVVAILVTGTLFGFAHFSHPEVGVVLLPYYIAVAVVYGVLAHLTDSVFPSMALHAGGNMLGALGLFTQGRSEWQPLAVPRPLIWQTGVDAAFIGSLIALLVVGAAAVMAYMSLATATAEGHGEH